MSIPQTPSPLSVILASKTYNAAWFSGATKEAQINTAIASAAADGASYVYVPASMLPYNTTAVTFNNAVKMLREGGDQIAYDVRAYGAAGDNVANDTPAFNAAILAANANGGGEVRISKGQYKLLTTVHSKPQVSIKGLNASSCVLLPVACDAIDIEWIGVGLGIIVFSDFGITGVSCTGPTHTAIVNRGSTPSNASLDELDGVMIERVIIQNYNTAMRFTTMRVVKVSECWLTTVTTGIRIEGQVIQINLFRNNIVGGAGAGAGTSVGIYVGAKTYTVGGPLGPESVHLMQNTVFGFQTAVNISQGIFVNILACDLQGSIYGIEFTSPLNGFTIRDCFIEVDGTGGIACIIGHSLGLAGTNVTLIDRNALMSTGVAVCRGVTINEVGGQFQDGIRITNNYISVADIDIVINNGNDVVIRENKCVSTIPIYNLYVNNPLGPSPIIVEDNNFVKGIAYTDTDVLTGKIQLGVNTVGGVLSYVGVPDSWRTPGFNAANFTASGTMAWGLTAPDVETYAFAINNKRMTVSVSLTTTSVTAPLSTTLKVLIPGGKTSAKRMAAPCYIVDNGVKSTGWMEVAAAGTTIDITRTDGANWTAAVNTTDIRGQISFEIQ